MLVMSKHLASSLLTTETNPGELAGRTSFISRCCHCGFGAVVVIAVVALVALFVVVVVIARGG